MSTVVEEAQRRVSALAEPETISAERLVAAARSLAGSTDGLPGDVVRVLEEVRDNVEGLAPRLDVVDSDSRAAQTIGAALTRELPAAVRLFRRLPATYDIDGRSAHDLLLEQVGSVATWLRDVDARVCAIDAQRLAAHGAALTEKLSSPASMGHTGIPDLTAFVALHGGRPDRRLRPLAVVAGVFCAVALVVVAVLLTASPRTTKPTPPASVPTHNYIGDLNDTASPTTPAALLRPVATEPADEASSATPSPSCPDLVPDVRYEDWRQRWVDAGYPEACLARPPGEGSMEPRRRGVLSELLRGSR